MHTHWLNASTMSVSVKDWCMFGVQYPWAAGSSLPQRPGDTWAVTDAADTLTHMLIQERCDAFRTPLSSSSPLTTFDQKSAFAA